jgi:hypothetical protein
MKIYEDVKLNGNLRPDLIIELQHEKVIIEVKKTVDNIKVDPIISQVITYFKHSDITQGIIFLVNTTRSTSQLIVEERYIELENVQYRIGIITN